MPGPLIAFWLLIGLGGGLALADKQSALWDRVDPSAHSSGRLDKPMPYSWLSSSPYQIARPTVYGREQCVATVFAVTGGRRVMRVVIDGQEQLLDTSWSREVEAAAKVRRVVTVRYYNPADGTEAACHTLSFVCITQTWDGRVQETVSNGELCQ